MGQEPMGGAQRAEQVAAGLEVNVVGLALAVIVNRIGRRGIESREQVN